MKKVSPTTAFRALIVLLLIVCAVSAGAAAGTGPRIKAAEVNHDFGKVKAGVRAEHVFEIKNTGDGVLVIGKIQPS